MKTSPLHLPRGLLRPVLTAARLGLISLVASACAKPETAGTTSAFVGAWTQVYPRAGAMEKLILDTGGGLRGSVAGLDSIGGRRATVWREGSPLSPDEFCIGDGRQWLCQAFLISGDTLWLANGRNTTYLRANSGGSGAIRPWSQPSRVVPARTPPD